MTVLSGHQHPTAASGRVETPLSPWPEPAVKREVYGSGEKANVGAGGVRRGSSLTAGPPIAGVGGLVGGHEVEQGGGVGVGEEHGEVEGVDETVLDGAVAE